MNNVKVHEFGRTRDILSQTYQALIENRRRALWCLSALLIGAASVIITMTFTNNVRQKLFLELESYGLSTFWVYTDRDNATIQSSGIQNSDYEFLKNNCCPEVVNISPEVYFKNWNVLIKTNEKVSIVVLEGVGQSFLDISQDTLVLGRNFSNNDIRNKNSVALIGSAVRTSQFGTSNPVGKTIQIEDRQFRVIGLLKEKRRNILSSIGALEKFDINNRILIPYTLHQQMLGSKDINALKVEAKQGQIPQAKNQIVQALNHRHNNKYNYVSNSLENWVETADRIFTNISLLGAACAMIFFIIAGWGIRTIVHASFVKSTHEISIRKMIGASDLDIFAQFLFQATTISAFGGILGAILAAIVGFVILVWSGLPATPTTPVLLGTIFLSMVVGIIAAYKPARLAANLESAEVLHL